MRDRIERDAFYKKIAVHPVIESPIGSMVFDSPKGVQRFFERWAPGLLGKGYFRAKKLMGEPVYLNKT